MNKGVLYTTYFANQHNAIGYKISIVRVLPKWIDFNKTGIVNIKALSPSLDLLLKYKNGTYDWQTYTKEFIEEMTSNMNEVLLKLKTLLDKGSDITLICYEKDVTFCHRSIIANYFKQLGYVTKEI